MARKRLPIVDRQETPAERIATGLHKVGLAIKHQTWLAAAEDGLSPTQGQILAVLASDGSLTGTELAQRLGITLPTISDSVRALVDKGLLTRSPDPRHPRASLLALTAAGRKRAASARAWPEFLATAATAMSEAEQGVFLVGLTKMIRTLQEQGQIPVQKMCVSCVHFAPNVHDGEAPHHCAFVDAPFGNRELKVDCADHDESPAEQRERNWTRFAAG